jgi:hypothetical protein
MLHLTRELQPASHAVIVERLRACIERGHEQVTMLEIPDHPAMSGQSLWSDLYLEDPSAAALGSPLVWQSDWVTDAFTVTVRGPAPAGVDVMPGDFAVRFTKQVRADIQVWDQGDNSVWWHPEAGFLGVSPWFTVPAPAIAHGV